ACQQWRADQPGPCRRARRPMPPATPRRGTRSIAPPEGALHDQMPFLLGNESLPNSTSNQVVKAPSSKASQLGQFMTPESISRFMAGLFGETLPSEIRLLDAGAGKGALTTAFINHWMISRSDGVIQTTCYEIDQEFSDILRENISLLGPDRNISSEVRNEDFIDHASSMIRLGKGQRFTHAILNPPYKKINTASHHRACLSAIGLETVNLYAGFVGLAIAMMESGGDLVAIIPRSFCNGPYYQPFRHFIFRHASIRHIHLFGARNKAFKGDGVLQENIIIHLTRGEKQGEVTISTSTDDTFSDYRETIHAFGSIVLARDAEQFIHIPTDDGPDLLTGSAFQYRLDELGVSVSTGPVVDFRMKNDLRAEYEPGTVPLLYPGHFTRDGFAWPKPGFKKANAIRETRETVKWLFPCGFYTVVRRFSSKEERRRIIANVVEPAALPTKMIGFENHLNVFHDRKQPLSEDMARGMAVYLNATVVDQCFRRFNGHTQVNATDLKTMRYPSRDALTLLGKWAKSYPQPSQEVIDARVTELA
ncbi:Eco57I restriction-modification methylase domain-containing protein, partial [Mesorhizobium sp. M0621]|uniref:Eco57I restriction-modification methylase domain-containing protein n=1 Tax=Mesorhizobium sp. M0621 TaxID=2956974 RepID=UPI00333C9370